MISMILGILLVPNTSVNFMIISNIIETKWRHVVNINHSTDMIPTNHSCRNIDVKIKKKRKKHQKQINFQMTSLKQNVWKNLKK